MNDVIITMAGKGTRTNKEVPKQFLKVPDTDSSIYQHAKIRRSDTTAILEKDLEANWDF